MLTIRQEIKLEAKKILDKKRLVNNYVNEKDNNDPITWLSKAILDSHVFAIIKACNLLREISSDKEIIEEIENRLIIEQLDKF